MTGRPVYTVRLAAHSGATSGVTALFTVPSGHTYVIRDVTLFCSAGPGQAFIQDGSTGIPQARADAAATLDLHTESRRIVYPAGSVCNIGVVSGTWSAWLSGYDLTTP